MPDGSEHGRHAAFMCYSQKDQAAAILSCKDETIHVLQSACNAKRPRVFGLASSTALTLLVIPAIYIWLRDDGIAASPEGGRPGGAQRLISRIFTTG